MMEDFERAITWDIPYVLSPGTSTVTVNSNVTLGTLLTPAHLCPDLLRYENIGEADGWRGRVVRAFFWCMRLWKVP